MFSKIVTCALLLILFLILGCKKEADVRQIVSQETALGVIHHPDFSEIEKECAQKVIDNWENNTIEPEPVLMWAGYLFKKNETFLLMLTMSDENYNIEGIIIKERTPENEIIVEDYPVFLGKNVGHFQYVELTVRECRERKDQHAWDEYVNQEQPSKDNRPKVFMSVPESDSNQMSIQIYDRDGYYSNEVQLRAFIDTRIEERLNIK